MTLVYDMSNHKTHVTNNYSVLHAQEISIMVMSDISLSKVHKH